MYYIKQVPGNACMSDKDMQASAFFNLDYGL